MRKTVLAAALIAATALTANAAQAGASAAAPQVASKSHAPITSPKMVITPMKVDPANDPSYSWYANADRSPINPKMVITHMKDPTNATSKPFSTRVEH